MHFNEQNYKIRYGLLATKSEIINTELGEIRVD